MEHVEGTGGGYWGYRGVQLGGLVLHENSRSVVPSNRHFINCIAEMLGP